MRANIIKTTHSKHIYNIINGGNCNGASDDTSNRYDDIQY
jgi:hypothetical protein